MSMFQKFFYAGTTINFKGCVPSYDDFAKEA